VTREEWVRAQGWEPLPFQLEVWEAIARGESGLVHSSTGSGKTLSVWLGYLPRAGPRPGLKALWITPLRALAADTVAALRAPLAALGLDGWRVEERTGDTSSSAKSRQVRESPDAIVTTPESLSLLLANPAGVEVLRGLEFIVVDEWHELLGSKRGAMLELALARVRRLADVQVWGLSATLGNTEEAARVLHPRGCGRIVRGGVAKEIVVDSLLPPSVERFPWAGHIGLRMAEAVAEELESCRTALVFTNTRAQAEIWYQRLLELRPVWQGAIGLHHGSLDWAERKEVEDGLKEGRLRAVVATSSLDLGVDFSPVDRVFQIGSPKGVARLLQRAGRSGHRPGEPSRVTCVPTHALELIDFDAVRSAIAQGEVEPREPLRKPMDVLVQHLVTLATGAGFTSEEALDEARSTYAFGDLTDDEWGWALDFVCHGGPALGAYPDYKKVVARGGVYRIADRRMAMRHRMNIGTIASDAAMTVQYLRGAKIGTVEESFVSRLKRGDVFAFGGRALEFVMTKDLVCYVRNAGSRAAVVPRWSGGRMPLSTSLAAAVRRTLAATRRGETGTPELALAEPMLEVQRRWSRIPAEDELLIESLRTRDGYHLFLYPLDGRMVHEGLGALLATRLGRWVSTTFRVACNDYGIEILSSEPAPLEEALANGLLSTEGVVDDVIASLNATEMARRQFREIARIAGLVLPSLPGRQKSVRQVQASAGLLFDVFAQFDPANRLYQQATREALDRQLDESRMIASLRRLASAKLVITYPPKPTPFAFPILVDRLRETVSSEDLDARIERMLRTLDREAG
jgi:ATP-dependent Lhr-like helicase